MLAMEDEEGSCGDGASAMVVDMIRLRAEAVYRVRTEGAGELLVKRDMAANHRQLRVLIVLPMYSYFFLDEQKAILLFLM
jgi:hypothetical protein